MFNRDRAPFKEQDLTAQRWTARWFQILNMSHSDCESTHDWFPTSPQVASFDRPKLAHIASVFYKLLTFVFGFADRRENIMNKKLETHARLIMMIDHDIMSTCNWVGACCARCQTDYWETPTHQITRGCSQWQVPRSYDDTFWPVKGRFCEVLHIPNEGQEWK